ncbi:MAG: citrate synthase [Myxococcales bacterium]|nr:citrate synthase [Myxococcales bacterium]
MAITAEIRVGADKLDLPVIVGSEGEVGIDIGTLRDKTGAITLDPGYGNTGAGESAITFLDGELGILRYRGYPIEQLAGSASFLEVSWLLLKGELPTAAELANLIAAERANRAVPDHVQAVLAACPQNTHPMAMLASCIVTLSSSHSDEDDAIAGLPANQLRLMAQLPVIAAYIYRRSQGLPLVPPDSERDYAANFLHMMFAGTGKQSDDVAIANAMDLLFILHADHEQNCSTSTVRLVGSSQADYFASVAAGVCALWGPLHGGANQAVVEMLDEIVHRGGKVDWVVAQAKDKASGFRLMGFGHRVYKNFDPRAKLIKVQADVVLDKLGKDDEQLDLAIGLEHAALADEYFVQRKLYPNVDFYSGIIYRAMGFPQEMFTVLFAIGRLPGWTAHWNEHNAGKARIGRPRQIYTGRNARDFVPLQAR